jgi:predicted alpha/beta superfamily hydrolase
MRPYVIFVSIACVAACSSSSGSDGDGNPSSDSGSIVDSGSGQDAEHDVGSETSADAGSESSTDSGVAHTDTPSETASTHVVLRVHYPAGSHTVTIRGASSPWSWDKGVATTSGGVDTYVFESDAITAATEWKPLLDDATWSRGPNYVVRPGETIDVYPHFTTAAGTYSRAYTFHSTILSNDRGIWIYLPPTYLENTDARLPVLYMHDGQNLFDASTAFGGNEWKVDETMDAGAESAAIREAIVIGIENTSARMWEYTPTVDSTVGDGGGADDYLKMIVTELKPKIDADLRTLPDRDTTGILGSSLGGLVSAYAGDRHAETFGIVGAMSPSTWWDGTWILGDVEATKGKSPSPLRVYVDSGDSGPSSDDVTNTAKLAQSYRDVGYLDGSTLDYLVQPGGQHNEIYWAERLPGALHFMLGARPNTP